MSEAQAMKRKITIQLGVCKRMTKEVKYYEKEVEENTMKVQRMRDNNQDSYDIKKQEEVLGESIMMIPDSQRRCGEAMKKLSELLEEANGVCDENDVTILEAQRLISDFYPLESEAKESSAAETFDENKDEIF